MICPNCQAPILEARFPWEPFAAFVLFSIIVLAGRYYNIDWTAEAFLAVVGAYTAALTVRVLSFVAAFLGGVAWEWLRGLTSSDGEAVR